MTAIPTLTPPARIDPASNPHLAGLFAPSIDEIDVTGLHIDGLLPDEIAGSYLCNGPNPRFTPLGSYRYPFDGDGMIHRIDVSEGKAGYRNRFVRTPALTAEEACGHALWPGLAEHGYTPGASLVGPALAHAGKHLPNVNVIQHGGKLLALGDSDTPFHLHDDLTTLGPETFCGTVPAGITGHPKIDPATGEMVAFCSGLHAPYLTWSVIGPDGLTRRAPTAVDGVHRPVKIHDMALTATYVVLVLSPLFLDVTATGVGASLSWEPDHGTRIALIPRDGRPVRWLYTGAFWSSHAANAYDVPACATADRQDQTVVLDLAAWTAPEGFTVAPPTGSLLRLHLDPATGSVRRDVLIDRAVDRPRIDDRLISRRHRVIAFTMTTGPDDLPAGDADSIGWYDTPDGVLTVWRAVGSSVTEPTFVPRAGSTDPRDGWWVTLATDRIDHTSRLLVIDARTPGAGPVAAVQLPQRVPLGGHSTWIPTERSHRTDE